jgi:hypothetical protein
MNIYRIKITMPDGSRGTCHGIFADVSFAVHRGESVGIAGLLGAAPQVLSISSKAGAKGRRAAVGTSVKGRRAAAGTSVKGRSSTAGSGGAHVPTIAQDYAAATAINSAAAAVASRPSTNAADGFGEVAGGNQYPLAAVTVAGRVAAAAKAAALLDDEARAFHLFEAAAQQGDAAGMAGLAECFLYGRGGVRRNVDVAVATARANNRASKQR